MQTPGEDGPGTQLGPQGGGPSPGRRGPRDVPMCTAWPRGPRHSVPRALTDGRSQTRSSVTGESAFHSPSPKTSAWARPVGSHWGHSRPSVVLGRGGDATHCTPAALGRVQVPGAP